MSANHTSELLAALKAMLAANAHKYMDCHKEAEALIARVEGETGPNEKTGEQQ